MMKSESIEQLRNLSEQEVRQVAINSGTPLFIYDENVLVTQARQALAFPAPYGLTVRYAMKANPHPLVIQTFHKLGVQIDASSGYEADAAIQAGIPAANILITTQEFPRNLKDLVDAGAQFNACSLNQLERYGELFPGGEVGIRVNPGMGSGHSGKTNVGGPSSSFGIWYEYLDQVDLLAKKFNLRITRMHTHIGSGTDPDVWHDVAHLSLAQVKRFPDVRTLNLGGGFKVARMAYEKSADLQIIGKGISAALEEFYTETGRKLHLEIEPGTFLVANAGSLLTTIHDIVDTGKEGFTFLKIDGGMTEILRPSLYASQHPIIVIPKDRTETEAQDYVVVGHCCESGDLLTPDPHDHEKIAPRRLTKAQIGDLLVIEGVGAYCASMSARNYNSFPTAKQVMKTQDGVFHEMMEWFILT